VDHLFEREGKLRICRREPSIAGGLAFGVAMNVGGGGWAVFVEPRKVGGKIPRDGTAQVTVSHEEIKKLCKLRSARRHDGIRTESRRRRLAGNVVAVDERERVSPRPSSSAFVAVCFRTTDRAMHCSVSAMTRCRLWRGASWE
jgi:hypothetical protein